MFRLLLYLVLNRYLYVMNRFLTSVLGCCDSYYIVYLVCVFFILSYIFVLKLVLNTFVLFYLKIYLVFTQMFLQVMIWYCTSFPKHFIGNKAVGKYWTMPSTSMIEFKLFQHHCDVYGNDHTSKSNQRGCMTLPTDSLSPPDWSHILSRPEHVGRFDCCISLRTDGDDSCKAIPATTSFGIGCKNLSGRWNVCEDRTLWTVHSYVLCFS